MLKCEPCTNAIGLVKSFFINNLRTDTEASAPLLCQPDEDPPQSDENDPQIDELSKQLVANVAD